MLLFRLLLAFLTLGADPPGDDPPADPPGDDPPEDDLPDLGDDDPPDDPPGDDPANDDPAVIREQLKAASARADKAEREAREASERAAAAERARSQQPPPRSKDQEIYEQEEARLKAADVTPLERWQIESNRSIRAQSRIAQQALNESREIADKADFDRYATANPGIAKRYGPRVEQKLAEIRQTGANMPRKVLLKMLIGEDVVDGKVKSTKRANGDGAQPRTVDRGKAASARSDVGRRGGGTSEHEKRRARLANVQI